jgi:gliding motility-associated-like protein
VNFASEPFFLNHHHFSQRLRLVRSAWTFILLVVLSFPVESIAQGVHPGDVVAAFDLSPNPVCAKDSVRIDNTSQGATSFRWSFTTGSTAQIPHDANFGNVVGFLVKPKYVTLVRSGNDYYSFISNAGRGTVVLNYHGTNLYDHPDSTRDIVNENPLNSRFRGIQIRNDNGTWYGFVVRENMLVRLTFGSSLGNTPTTTDIGSGGNLEWGDGLVVCRQDNQWLGFCTDSAANRVVRFDFGNSLDNDAPATSVLSVPPGVLINPGQFVTGVDNDSLYMFVCNSGTQSISRLRFGTTWLNNSPEGENLGNVVSLDRVSGISLIEDCQSFTGFVTNKKIVSDALTRLTFPGGLGGPVVGANAGHSGTLDYPEKISEMVRHGDSIFALITNSYNSSLSVLYFPGFGLVNPAESVLENPPAVCYSTPGIYTVRLTINAGQAAELSTCRQIVVLPAADVALGNNRTICSGSTISLDAGDGFVNYTWNTGETSRQITVGDSGLYIVRVENASGCSDTDSIEIYTADTMRATVDTSICHGGRYYAGNQWRRISGTYLDYRSSVFGCDSIVTTNLVVKPQVLVSLGNDTLICHGDPLKLSVFIDSAAYTWQDGSQDSVFNVTQPGIYYVTALKQGCSGSDTIVVSECPPDQSAVRMPTAFSPNGDGLNDIFKADCQNILKFHMLIFDRWGTIVFDSIDPSEGWTALSNASYYPPGVYTYRIDYQGAEAPGEDRIQTGTVTLVR